MDKVSLWQHSFYLGPLFPRVVKGQSISSDTPVGWTVPQGTKQPAQAHPSASIFTACLGFLFSSFQFSSFYVLVHHSHHLTDGQPWFPLVTMIIMKVIWKILLCVCIVIIVSPSLLHYISLFLSFYKYYIYTHTKNFAYIGLFSDWSHLET